MSDPISPITDRAEFLGLLPGYLNGLLDETDRQRMDKAQQQHPEWQNDIVFDQLWKEAMQNHKSKLDNEEAWLMFKEQLVQADLIKRQLRFK